VHIEDPEGLDHAIAIHLLQKQAPLSNKELRFLRQQIGLSQADLGMPVGADAQTVARWEKNEAGTDSPATRLAQAVFLLHLGGNEDLRRYVANLKLMDRVLNESIIFSEHDGDWQVSTDEPCPAQ